jgi:hypothetical protein
VSRSGLVAIREALTRLGVEAGYVLYGHTHRPGPLPFDDRADWRLPGGTQLYATGSWTYSPGLCGPSPERSLFWPGTVTWVGDEGPPVRRELLHGRTHSELTAAMKRTRAAGRRAGASTLPREAR